MRWIFYNSLNSNIVSFLTIFKDNLIKTIDVREK